MMTQSVMTQAANLFGNATKSATLKGKRAGSGFDLMIDNSLKAKNPPSNTEAATVKKTSVHKKDNYFSDECDEAGDVTQKAKAAEPQDMNAAKQTENVHADKPAATKEKEETPTIDEQLLAQIITMLQTVSEAIMEKLNLSPEEFNQLLADQGMTAADLLEPGNLQKFILANSGETDILAVLTNGDLADTMNNLMKQVAEIKSEAGILLNVSQIKDLLVQAEAAKVIPETESPVEDKAVVLTDDGTSRKQAETDKSADTSNSPVTASTEKDQESKTDAKTAQEKENLTDTTKTEGLKESNSGTQDNTGKKENTDLKSSDQFQMFIDNLVKATKDTQVEFGDSMAQLTRLREIADQIIERIKISIAPDQSSMELQLNPESLGKVNLTVQSREGVMTAQFVVQNEVSKEAIESQLNTLRETLNQQGIKVEAIEVTVSANAFEQNNGEGPQNQADTQKNNSGRQITLEDAMNMTETPEEDSILQDVTGTLGSQIDYTA